MKSSEVFLTRLLNFANRMNNDLKTGNKADYEHAEGVLNFTAELATDMGHEVHIFWQSDGQITGVQVGKLKGQAIVNEEP